MQNDKRRPSEADALPTPPVETDAKKLVTPGDDGSAKTDAPPETVDKRRSEGAAAHDHGSDQPREAFSGRNDD